MRWVRYGKLVAGLLLATALPIAAAPSADGVPWRSDVIRSILVAAETEPARIDAVESRVHQKIESIVARLGDGDPTYRKARRLHRMLHRDTLLRYDADADGFHALLDDGSYNCTASALLYALISRTLGYETWVLSKPGHLLVRLRIGERVVDVETTTVNGFDARRRSVHDAGDHAVAQPEALSQTAGARKGTTADPLRPWRVTVEQAVGFAWINRAWRELDRGQGERSAASILEAHRYLRALTARAEGVRRLLARAFGQEYDAGRFEAAYRIALAEITLFPRVTTSRDRLLAVALKRVQGACDADRPAEAAATIREIRAACPWGADLARLERRAWAAVASAAVRTASWDLAEHAAGAYAKVEPDPREAARLRDWVGQRRDEAGLTAGDPVCPLHATQSELVAAGY
jgi:hypothetical protein